MQGAIQVCCFSLLFIIIVIIISSWSCGSVNHWLTLLGSYHSHSGQSSLASCTRANHVQARSYSLPISARHSSSILVWINCIESPTCRRGAGWGQHPTDLTFVHHSWSLLETACLLLLALESGTVSLKTSHLLHHWQCFDINWRLTCFGTRTQTLLLRHSGFFKFFLL